MTVYRISTRLYSNDLSGTGAKLYGARWNSKGTAMLYSTEFISLALLEMLVHTQFKDYAIPLDLVHLHLPESVTIKEITLPKLKSNWHEDEDYSRFIGDEFIKSKQALILKVPSAVVQEEHNFLVNPLHADFKKIKIHKTTSFRPDKRLFSI
ncbi:MAG: RES family NAD+ phosphorylase [Ferruginibacter sp.]|nr:RES family NAD+ phosphorylase [Ferruginibacter sp.]